MTASGLTSERLHHDYVRNAIVMYLRTGETSDGIIKNFSGDLNKTIQFLRERSYEGMEIVERKVKSSSHPKVKTKDKPKEEPNILDPMYEPKPGDYITETKKKKSLKPKATPGTQVDLF